MISEFLSNHTQLITEILILTAIMVISFKFIDIFEKQTRASKSNDSTLLSFMPLINKILKIIVAFIAIATLLQNHGYSITSLVAGFGITGLAVGFGAKETIANVFGSFSLLADKAYKIGDYIIINQTVQDKPVEGIVEEINLRSTKIKSADNGIIIVPNNVVANGVVKNLTQNGQ